MADFKPRKVLRALAVLAATASAGASAAQDAGSAPQATEQANSSGWGVQCANNAENQMRCSAALTVTASENNQAIFSISLQEAPEETTPTLIMRLPFGLNLPRGIDLTIDDGEPQTFEVSTCLQNGCYVVQQAEQELIEAMVAGQSLSVRMEASNGGETRMDVTLTGFSNALDRLN